MSTHLRIPTTLLLGAFALGGCSSTPTPTKGTQVMEPAIAQLQEAERTWVRALTAPNPELLVTLIDDEFSFIGPDGQFENRDAYLAGYRAMSSMGVVVESIDMDDVKIRVLGDTGVITGHVLAKVKFQGQPVVEDVRFTRIYKKRGAGWRMIAGQGTRLAAQPNPT